MCVVEWVWGCVMCGVCQCYIMRKIACEHPEAQNDCLFSVLIIMNNDWLDPQIQWNLQMVIF
jgi:hypothetical protein